LFLLLVSLHEEEDEMCVEGEREPGRLDLIESLEYKQDRSLCAARSSTIKGLSG
jgi:hypothetical protein